MANSRAFTHDERKAITRFVVEAQHYGAQLIGKGAILGDHQIIPGYATDCTLDELADAMKRLNEAWAGISSLVRQEETVR